MSVPTKVRPQELGKFNVHILIRYLDDQGEEFDVKHWIHTNNYLAMSFYDNSLKVVNLDSTKFFVVSGQESKELDA